MKFRTYSLLLNSFLLVAGFITLACGAEVNMDEFASFFQPQSSRTHSEDERYFFSPGFLYGNGDGIMSEAIETTGHSAATLEMVADWKHYFDQQLDDSTVYHMLTDAALPNKMLTLKNHTEIIQYLALSSAISSVEPAEDGFETRDSTRLAAKKDSLFKQVAPILKTEKDPFLRQRYAFQVIRLASDLKKNDSALVVYKQHFNHPPSNNLDYWALSRIAGVNLHRHDTALAIYQFSQVFAACPSKRFSSYLSLRNNGVKFSPVSVAFCKNNLEKANVYALGALMPGQKSFDLMQKIVDVDPGNPLIELIMSREINKSEYYYQPAPPGIINKPDSLSPATISEGQTYIGKLRDFAATTAKKPTTTHPAFWYTASSYLSYMLKDTVEANAYLRDADKISDTSQRLASQINLQKILFSMDAVNGVTPATELAIIGPLEALATRTTIQQNNALMHVCSRLSNYYLAKGVGVRKRWWQCNQEKTSALDSFRTAKSFLVKEVMARPGGNALGLANVGDAEKLQDTTSSSVIRNAIAYLSSARSSDFDKRLIVLSGVTLNNLNLVAGRRALAEFNYKEAENAFKKIGDSVWSNEPFKSNLTSNPFAIDIAEGSGGTFADSVRYTPLSFTRKMISLEQSIAKDPAKASNYYYLMASGAYNMSYYGNSWVLVKNYRSSNELDYRDQQTTAADKLNYYTAAKAQEYFSKALATATDKETQARACFMAAKCEEKQYFLKSYEIIAKNRKKGNYHIESVYNDSLLKIRYKDYSTYFMQLSSKYKGSQYEKMVKGECADYEDFLGNR